MMCLKRDNNEGMSFSTHFLVIRQTCICWGLNFLFLLNLLSVLNLVYVLNLILFFFLLIVIHNFLTLEYSGVRDMLITRMASIILINHVVPLSHQLTLELFFLYSVEFNNQIIDLFFHLDKRLMCELS
jgi:hypothetical protein